MSAGETKPGLPFEDAAKLAQPQSAQDCGMEEAHARGLLRGPEPRAREESSHPSSPSPAARPF